MIGGPNRVGLKFFPENADEVRVEFGQNKPVLGAQEGQDFGGHRAGARACFQNGQGRSVVLHRLPQGSTERPGQLGGTRPDCPGGMKSLKSLPDE